MAKYRIVRRPSTLDPSVAVYEVEESFAFNWWHPYPCGIFDTFEEAEQRVLNLKEQEQHKIERQVIRVYD